MSLPVHEWRFEVGRPDHGARLDGFLSERLSWRSRAGVKRAIDQGRVEVDPHKDPQRASVGRLRGGLRLRVGQEVVVRLPAPQAEPGAGERTFEPDEIAVVYEDSWLLAVSKPPHLNVYPTRRHRAGSLIELVHERGQAAGEPPPSPCHRLDRETSGLLVFAKGREARDHLQQQFEARTVRKTYLALVVGSMSGDQGRVDWPIESDQASVVEIRQRAGPDGAGRSALTHWRARERFDGATLVELEPSTGRQHQLRVHMAALGHPILGDKLYLGGDDLFLRSLEGDLSAEDLGALGLARQALHAWRLELRHPDGDRPLRLEAPIWPDFEEAKIPR